MSLSYLYSELNAENGAGVETATTGDEASQEELLQNFESGYQAGWDDALESCTTAQTQSMTDIAQVLQDMSFTYHEAHSKIIKSLRPLMVQIVELLLPEVARDTLGPLIVEHLGKLVDANSGNVIELAVAPETHDQIEALLNEQITTPFSLKSETTLTSGQAYLRSSDQERMIDFDIVLQEIKAVIAAFYDNAPEEFERG